jgi:hypothetical protein
MHKYKHEIEATAIPRYISFRHHQCDYTKYIPVKNQTGK